RAIARPHRFLSAGGTAQLAREFVQSAFSRWLAVQLFCPEFYPVFSCISINILLPYYCLLKLWLRQATLYPMLFGQSGVLREDVKFRGFLCANPNCVLLLLFKLSITNYQFLPPPFFVSKNLQKVSFQMVMR